VFCSAHSNRKRIRPLLAVGAGTSGTSDKDSTDGLVDNHAYTVIESRNNVCGTGIDLLKVRNPWGSGEIEDGEVYSVMHS
jgi:Calpain family cysteine protease